jgi:ketosteroid isomerase-like protein
MFTTRLLRMILPLALGVASVPRLPAESAAPEAGAFVRDFYAAYGAKDTEKLGEFYAADATFEDPTFELNLKGPGQIKHLLNIVLVKYESLDWEIAHTLVAGDDVIVEGTMVGKLAEKTARVRFVSVFHFVGGKIAGQRDLFDVLHFYTQLGVVPPQFRPKAPVAPPPPAPAGS